MMMLSSGLWSRPSTLMMEATRSSEASINFGRTTWRHIPKTAFTNKPNFGKGRKNCVQNCNHKKQNLNSRVPDKFAKHPMALLKIKGKCNFPPFPLTERSYSILFSIYVTHTWAVRKVSSHFQYLENRSRGIDVTWQPVRGDLTAHPWTVTLPWG